MKVESDNKEFGGVKLSTTKLPPARGYVLSPKLLRVVGPILAAGRLQDIDASELAEGLLKYSDDERMKLMTDVFASTTAKLDGEILELTSEVAINRAFPDMFALLQALWWVIGFNFFPSGVVEKVGALIAAKMKGFPST